MPEFVVVIPVATCRFVPVMLTPAAVDVCNSPLNVVVPEPACWTKAFADTAAANVASAVLTILSRFRRDVCPA
ncbi:MAG: hypothetical protein ACKPJD_22170, partial [Planctomycetaceae bacterium]